MSLETFNKILPALSRTQLAYLQGWGEPFCNPHFFEMLRLARERGCRVGTSTNGILLDEDKLNKLIDAKIDLIAFSLAGCGEHNDKIRLGTKFDKIMEHINFLCAVKEKRGIDYPDIHIAYLLLKSKLDELDELPSLLNNKGVSQVVISTLDFVPSSDYTDEIIAPETQDDYDRFNARLEAVAEKLVRHNIKMHYHLRHPENKAAVCTENIERAFFVAADGSVSPCVFLNIPAEDVKFIERGVEKNYRRLIFGNVNRQSPAKIWKSDSYRKFRESFSGGSIPPGCITCPKLYMS